MDVTQRIHLIMRVTQPKFFQQLWNANTPFYQIEFYPLNKFNLEHLKMNAQNAHLTKSIVFCFKPKTRMAFPTHSETEHSN